MVKKKGKFPANARVDVDYTKNKPQIKFNYPSKNSKKQALDEHSMYLQTIILIILFWMIPYFCILINIDDANYKEYPEDCDVRLNKGFANVTLIVDGYEDFKETNSTVNVYKEFVKGAEFICSNGNYNVTFKRNYPLYHKDTYFSGHGNVSMNYKVALSLLGYFFIIEPLLIWILNIIITKILINNKKYCDWFPKAQANGIIFRTKKKKYRKFYPKDVLEKIIVIPKFSNVELDYKTEGDFSKYLERIKIREYKEQKINIKSNKKSKIKQDNYKWYAIFYFKEEPKKGFMEVIYQ